MLKPIILLTISNIFMTFAWYGHLKDLKASPLWIAVVISWAIAFFEYCFQVPANRIGITNGIGWQKTGQWQRREKQPLNKQT